MMILINRYIRKVYHTLILISGVLLSLPACSAGVPTPSLLGTPVPTTVDTITADNASALIESESLSQEGAGPVTALAFTSGHAQLRTVHARTPMLLQWDMNTRTVLSEYQVDSVGLGAAAFDKDANQVVLSGTANIFAFSDEYLTGISADQVTGPKDAVYVLDASNGQLLNYLNPVGFRGEFQGVAFSEDGQTIAAQGYNTDNKSYELVVFKKGANFSVSFHTPHAQNQSAVDFALDAEGRLLAEYSGNNSIQLWDLNSEKEWGNLKINTDQTDGESRHVFAQLAIAPTRQWLAGFSEVNGDSHFVTLWRLDKKTVQWQVEASDIRINAFAFNPSGDLLAIAADDGLHLWSVATGNELVNFPGEQVFAVTFSQDGSLLAWGDWLGTIHLAELEN